MNWPLFCHNRGIFPQSSFPGSGPFVAELINEGEISGGPESYVAVFEDKILWKKFEDQLVFSDDFGDTWTDKGLIPGFGDGFRCQRLAYHEPSGNWFMLTVNGNSDIAIQRSEDDGATWTAMTMPASTTFSTTSMIIDSFGRLLLSAGDDIAPIGEFLYRWDDPANNLNITTSYQYTSSVLNQDNLKELIGYGYAVSVWTGTVQNVELIPYAMSSDVYIAPAQVNNQDLIPWSESFNGIVYAWAVQVTSNPRFLKVFSEMNTTPAYLTLDFINNTEAYRIQASENYLLAYSQPIGIASVWKLMWSADGVAFSSELNLTLPTDPITDTGEGRNNLYHSRGNKWIAHYQDATNVKLVRFDLS